MLFTKKACFITVGSENSQNMLFFSLGIIYDPAGQSSILVEFWTFWLCYICKDQIHNNHHIKYFVYPSLQAVKLLSAKISRKFDLIWLQSLQCWSDFRNFDWVGFAKVKPITNIIRSIWFIHHYMSFRSKSKKHLGFHILFFLRLYCLIWLHIFQFWSDFQNFGEVGFGIVWSIDNIIQSIVLYTLLHDV